MSSSKSTPPPTPNTPDYVALTRFLVEPFLDAPDALRVSCEVATSKPKVWLRLAFDDGDRPRVFGRGGRNLNAIRTTLVAIAQIAGQSLSLEVYGSTPTSDPAASETATSDTGDRPPASRRRSRRSRPTEKPKRRDRPSSS